MTYSAEEREEAIAKVIAGLRIGTPLTVICSEEGMPGYTTIWEWKQGDEALSEAIACARDMGHDAIANRIRLTVRGKTEAEGGESSGDVQRDKLIADTDLKLLAKWDPKRYGDKVDVAHSGGIAFIPLQAHDDDI